MRTTWNVSVLLSFLLSPSLSKANSLVQVSPDEGDSTCANTVLAFNCTVEGTTLWWSYAGEVVEPFLAGIDEENKTSDLGPFRVVLVDITQTNTNAVILSTATIDNGITTDLSGMTISCMGSTFSGSKEIFLTELNVTNLSVCMGTISWTPPQCDANCTINVDGQVSDTVPCSDGNYAIADDPDLSSKALSILATDPLGRSALFSIISNEDCPGPVTSSVDVSPTVEPPSSDNTTLIVGASIAAFVLATVVIVALFVLVLVYIQRKRRGQSDAHKMHVFIVESETFKDFHQHPIIHCAISPEAKYIATADRSMVVRFWEITPNGDDLVHRETLQEFLERIRNHSDEIRITMRPVFEKKQLLLSMNWVLEHESTKLVLTYDNCVIVCDVQKEDSCILYEPKRQLTESVLTNLLITATSHLTTPSMLCTACSPDATFAFSFTDNIRRNPHLGYLVIGSSDELKENRPKTLCDQEPYVLCMSFSPTGKKLVTGNINGGIHIYTIDSDGSDPAYFGCKAHKGRVHDVQFSSMDDQKVYSLGEDGVFCLWDSSATRIPCRKMPCKGYQSPHPLTLTEIWVRTVSKDISHPAIGRSKLLGFCFEYKYILISSVERKVLHKVRADFNLSEVKSDLPEGPINCLDCVKNNEGYAACVMGSANGSVHFVKLRSEPQIKVGAHDCEKAKHSCKRDSSQGGHASKSKKGEVSSLLASDNHHKESAL